MAQRASTVPPGQEMELGIRDEGMEGQSGVEERNNVLSALQGCKTPSVLHRMIARGEPVSGACAIGPTKQTPELLVYPIGPSHVPPTNPVFSPVRAMCPLQTRSPVQRPVPGVKEPNVAILHDDSAFLSEPGGTEL